MKPKYNNTPLSYVEMYPAPIEQEKPPPLWAQALGVIVAAVAIYALLAFTFSL